FRVRVWPREALAGGGTATLRWSLRDGPGESEVRLEVAVFREPAMRIEWTGAGAVAMDAPGEPPELEGVVSFDPPARPRAGPVEVDVPWATASMAEGGRLNVRVDRRALLAAVGDERPAEVGLTLGVALEAPSVTVTPPLRLAIHWPPNLYLAGGGADARGQTLEWELPGDRYHLLLLSLGNSGGAALRVEQLGTEPAEALLPVQPGPPPGSAWQIDPGKERDFELAADLRGGGTTDAALTLSTNVPGGERARVPLRVVSRPRKPFRGHVGIDFGTSHSCIAVWPEQSNDPRTGVLLGGYRYAHEALPLPRPILPSAVLYHARPAENLLLCEVGCDDLTEGAGAARVLHSVKRYLGTRQALPVKLAASRPAVLRSAEEVAGDIVRRLLWEAEDVLGERIVRCAISHPVTFSVLLLARMKALLRELGVEVERMIPEPVAAALQFIVAGGIPVPDPTDYTMLVLDVGGGTSDFAVLRVFDEVDEESQTWRIRARRLSANGLRLTGGDDITWIAVERALAGDDPQLVAHRLGVSVDALPVIRAGIRSLDPGQWRDDEKLRRAFHTVDNAKRVAADEDWPSSGGMIGRGGSGWLELHEIAAEFLKENGILELAGRTVAQAQVQAPDVILLVGQSWRIKPLREAVEAHFAGIPTLPGSGATAEELKCPVALGTCRAHAFDDGSNLSVVLDDPRGSSTTRIGVMGYDLRRGTRAFVETIPANAPLGSWFPLRGVTPSRAKPVKIWENTHWSDHPELMEGRHRGANLELSEIGEFGLAELLPPDVTDADLAAPGAAWLSLDDNHHVQLKIVRGNESWVLSLRAV
ncbi:MAG TPA: Hsp70 family protein, partial [Longimicrobiaceae bacterium]|nr:Hsp70 family protein [Longimicrobiaceae bacterium]